MDRYFQKLGVYYDEKIKFLSGKDKFISCNKCDSKKEFKDSHVDQKVNVVIRSLLHSLNIHIVRVHFENSEKS